MVIDRVAVGQIERDDAQRALVGRENPFDETRLFIDVIARKAAIDLVEAQLRQDCDAVEALLAVRLDVIAQRLDLGARKTFVDRLDFLQADDVGRAFLQPVQQVVDAGADAVDVPGDDFHGMTVSMNRDRRASEKRLACPSS